MRELMRLSTAATFEVQRDGAISDELYRALEAVTRNLIARAEQNGALTGHPYAAIRSRTLPVGGDVERSLRGSSVLVTGAAGTIGSALSRIIAALKPARIVVLDRRAAELRALRDEVTRDHAGAEVEACHVDICSREALEPVFKTFRPEAIYHLAAQRQPGLAEKSAFRDTILTNVLGTKNVCELAAEFGADHLVHASSGKCRFIYEQRVYSATKKFSEAIARMVADRSGTNFATVRFHHIVENSIVEQIFLGQIAAGQPVTAHISNNMYQPGQSLREATAVLLNASLHGRRGEVFACAQDLDCFSVMELALYSIRTSGGRVPVVLQKLEEIDDHEITDLRGTFGRHIRSSAESFNVIESETVTAVDSAGLLKARFPDFDHRAMHGHLEDLLQLAGTDAVPAEAIKARLWDALADLSADIYNRAPLHLVAACVEQTVRSDLPFSASHVLAHRQLLAILLSTIARRGTDGLSGQEWAALDGAVAVIDRAVEQRPELLRLRETARRLPVPAL
jgi:nucleoside-diphosphate-sugar epimerase